MASGRWSRDWSLGSGQWLLEQRGTEEVEDRGGKECVQGTGGEDFQDEGCSAGFALEGWGTPAPRSDERAERRH